MMVKKNVAGFALLMAVLLSTFGYAYAIWSDSVVIKGQAKMGTMKLVFSDYEEPWAQEWHYDPVLDKMVIGEYEGKDWVAECGTIVSPDDWVWSKDFQKGGWTKFKIWVKNAYPCLEVRTTYVIENIGTVPGTIYAMSITGMSYDKDGNPEYLLFYDGNNPGVIYEDQNDNGVLDDDDPIVINIVITNGLPDQIDPDVVPDKREIDIHFKQPARQCHTYKFTVEILYVQWNKLYETYQ
jgi:hypothetical protein